MFGRRGVIGNRRGVIASRLDAFQKRQFGGRFYFAVAADSLIADAFVRLLLDALQPLLHLQLLFQFSLLFKSLLGVACQIFLQTAVDNAGLAPYLLFLVQFFPVHLPPV